MWTEDEDHEYNSNNAFLFCGYYGYVYGNSKYDTTTVRPVSAFTQKKEFFPITSVSRDDLEAKGFDTSDITDLQMEQLASRMADDYLEQMYWISMDIIAENLGFPKK